MLSIIDITTYTNVTSLIIALMNGCFFIFYFLLLIVYIKEYKYKNIIIFISIELTISSLVYSLFYIYSYIIKYSTVLCVINAIGQPAITVSSILLSANLLVIILKVIESQDSFFHKFTKYVIFSIMFCWILPLILMIILFFIDIQFTNELYKKCSFRSIPIKIVNYALYFVVCICMEFYFIKIQKEIKLFLQKIGEKENKESILQVQQFHIVNIINVLWQIFTILITFNLLKLSEYTLSIIKPIIRFLISIFFFLFLYILCISKERLENIGKIILCRAKEIQQIVKLFFFRR